MQPNILAVIITIPVIAILTYAIYHFGYFIYHWHSVVSNVTSKYSTLMGALLLLRTSNFNETGQESIIKSIYHFRRFFFSVIPLILFGIIGAITKVSSS